jgi:magnesium chelatase subunit D
MDWTNRTVYPFSAIVGQEKMKRVLLLNAVNPTIGGVLIRGEKGTAKSTIVRALAAVLPEIEVVADCPFQCDPCQSSRLCPDCRARLKRRKTLPVTRRKVRVVDLPLGVTEDRVVGSLDLERAIKDGKKCFEPGLLAAAHRGILYIDEVNLLNDHIVDIILDTAAMGVNIVEREGISFVHPAEFILVGTMNPEEGELRPQLLDRFGLCIQVVGTRDLDERVQITKLREAFDLDSKGFARGYQDEQHTLSLHIAQVREDLSGVQMNDDMVRLCSEYATNAFVAGHRADIIMRRTALAIATMEGKKRVSRDDVEEAAELVLYHRARMSPPPPQEEESTEEQEKPSEKKEHQGKASEARDKGEHTGDQRKEREGEHHNGEDHRKGSGIPRLDTVFSVGETFKVKQIQAEGDRVLRKASGRRSQTKIAYKAGRYIMSTMQRKTGDFALDATLRAAAPYQRQRQKEGVAIAIEKPDIREKIREKRVGNFIVFVVDASGSMGAGKRMIETKGAILSLLLDAYQKRDKVALVAFKGSGAEVLLPPTSSIELAHKLLEELPTGGKTPLCHGISLGYQIIESYFRKDPHIYPLLILISDGKANVSQYAGKPISEAMEMAGEIKNDTRVNTAVVDVEKTGLISFGLAHQLSIQMGARYLKLKDLKADTLVRALREDLLA